MTASTARAPRQQPGLQLADGECHTIELQRSGGGAAPEGGASLRAVHASSSCKKKALLSAFTAPDAAPARSPAPRRARAPAAATLRSAAPRGALRTAALPLVRTAIRGAEGGAAPGARPPAASAAGGGPGEARGAMAAGDGGWMRRGGAARAVRAPCRCHGSQTGSLDACRLVSDVLQAGTLAILRLDVLVLGLELGLELCKPFSLPLSGQDLSIYQWTRPRWQCTSNATCAWVTRKSQFWPFLTNGRGGARREYWGRRPTKISARYASTTV